MSLISNTLKVAHINIIQTSSNCAVAAQIQWSFYLNKFLTGFYISHVDIYNLHLFQETIC